MRLLPLASSCLGLFALAIPPCSALATWQEDYAQLTSGLTALEMSGSPGSVAILGRLAFPVARSSTREATVGCGYTGDQPNGGRVAAVAHTSLASATSPALKKWLANLAAWTSKTQTPTLLVLGGPSKDWQAAGIATTDAPKAWSKEALSKVQCVFINLHAVSPELANTSAADLAEFAAKGGGLIFSSTPWAAKPELLEFASKLMHPAGIAFLPSGPKDTQFPLGTPPSPFASGIRAAEALAGDIGGTAKLSLADRQIASSSAEACVAANLVPEPMERALLALHEKTGWSKFTAEQPLRRNLKPVEVLMARFENWWLQRQSPLKTPVHPLAADYPGLPAEGAPLKKTVRFKATTGPDKLINHGERTRISTGLYARPGAPVKVTIPQEAATAGWKLEVGIHTDRNWPLTSWRRFPEICTVTPLQQTSTIACNSFGGLVSILLPPNCPLGEAQVEVDGAVAAPVYKLGETTPEQWQSIKNAPGAWGYLETPLWTGYFSRAQLQAMDDPAKIAAYWHQAVKTADEFLGYTPWRRRGESMLIDRDIVVGYGHAGYPVMMAYGAEKPENANALAGRGPTQGDWGFLHELGHTFQDSFDGNYTMATHAEVDVNLVPGLVLQKLHKRTCWDNNSHGTFDAKSRMADWEKWTALPASEQTWEKACKMNVSYDLYFTLAECFGWDLYAKAFGRLMRWLQKPGADPVLDAIPEKSPSAKRDRFFVLFSQESGCNLLPFFQKYGLDKGEFNLGAGVKSAVAGLPAWTGNRPMEGVAGPQEIAVAPGAPAGLVVAKFAGKDPDPGTFFTYRIADGNADGAFAIDALSGEVTLAKAGKQAPRVLTIEAQDNCIPLTSAKTVCKAVFR
jgi:hypothetical protein